MPIHLRSSTYLGLFPFPVSVFVYIPRNSCSWISPFRTCQFPAPISLLPPPSFFPRPFLFPSFPPPSLHSHRGPYPASACHRSPHFEPFRHPPRGNATAAMSLPTPTVASVAAACAIAGAALAFTLAFFYMRFRYRGFDDHIAVDRKLLRYRAVINEIESITGTYVPGANPMRFAHERLRAHLFHWVRDFVTAHGRSAEGVDFAAFSDLAGDSEDWERQLKHVYLQEYTICAFVSRVLASRTYPECGLDTTLLPPHIAELWHSITTEVDGQPSWKKAHPQFQSYNWNHDSFLGRDLELRAMQKFLPNFIVMWTLHEYAFEGPIRDSDKRIPNIVKVEELILRTLAPFGGGFHGTIDCPESRRSLREIVENFAGLGWWCFGQARCARLTWPNDPPPGPERRVAWFPGLEVNDQILEEMRNPWNNPDRRKRMEVPPSRTEHNIAEIDEMRARNREREEQTRAALAPELAELEQEARLNVAKVNEGYNEEAWEAVESLTHSRRGLEAQIAEKGDELAEKEKVLEYIILARDIAQRRAEVGKRGLVYLKGREKEIYVWATEQGYLQRSDTYVYVSENGELESAPPPAEPSPYA
ncbi:hypothetical protein MAPG_01924 [Magnaporthiopsis poae ATCC 64411]|uniref:Uncharacterized protein n=1 Tax=Magnaporthiopsis poae (strain ATCC 64411 / 73-15) TaxID=644358 RepID=A0A0C4DPZ3_MAGP6|nr:hypothetical protein MAPG_01924 [Magnaporthiopsis poae ATCC 64411]